MSPHDSNPTPHTVEVDLSAILTPPQPVVPAQVTHTPECAIVHKQAETAIDSPAIRIGPFAWVSINFVLGSCLIAFFCTMFVSENLHFRRQPHLSDDIVYSRPEIDWTSLQGFKMELPQLGPGVQLDRSPIAALNRNGGFSNPGPGVSSGLPASGGQNSSLSPNPGRVADNGSVNNSSSTGSNGVPRDNSSSRATSSKSLSSAGTQRSSSVRSSVGKASGRSTKQTRSTRSRNSRSRQSARHSLAHSAGKLRTGRSRLTTSSGPRLNNHQGLHHASVTQTAAMRTQMSMHSTGLGSAQTQLRGAMNPMRMEGGMLAQPGLGGITGSGLGGGGGGHHGAQGRR